MKWLAAFFGRWLRLPVCDVCDRVEWGDGNAYDAGWRAVDSNVLCADCNQRTSHAE